ncbi:class I SAM-dependent methyltransferase [Actinomadura sp. WMMB 499]|uniref:class I SAM-dependent methyltransferase n=1 Tax=Actinomadura sp. WMMB 499 TaxID=1219491 RepID=UPI001243B62C|nr:class I SAM-dependent methyltransferase [Actinomadura sp. WMMB 499]QFG22931.1 class I SAM-dependent methyltransferase [Actinomadura sp. WMMB 499]
MTDDYINFKQTAKDSFEAGDYAPMAARLAGAAEELVAACGAGPGLHVLDVGAGTGNAAVAAARAGARATAADLTPAMVRAGRERTRAEGLPVDWDEADIEDLPYAEGTFDRVLAVFTANFAPRPRTAAAEMLRVLRPGGVLGLANWTPTGFAAAMSRALADLGPAPEACDDFSSPFLWGDEKELTALLGAAVEPVRLERRQLVWHFPSAGALWEELERDGGPAAARESMPEQEYARIREAALAVVAGHAETAGDGIAVTNEYLLAVVRRTA